MVTHSRITIEIKSLMPEKLINEITLRGVRVFRAHLSEANAIIIETDAKGAAAAKTLAEEMHLEFSVRRVMGFSAVFDFLRKRPTLPAAFLTAAVCIAFFLSRIWIIDVNILGGSVPGTYIECIRESGAVTGAAFSRIDLPLLSLRLSALDGIAYASASRNGVVLQVELAGEDAPPELYDISHARDLVAACSGVIATVDVKSGTAMVQPGDTVRRGQILIEGSERISDDETRSVGALGSVTARIWSEGFAETSLSRVEKEYTGRTSISKSLWIFGKEIPLKRSKEFEHFDADVSSVAIGGLFLPFRVTRTVETEYIPRPSYADPEESKNTLVPLAIADAEEKIPFKPPESTEIIDKWIDFSMIDTYTLRARAVIEYTTDIAVTRRYLEDK